MTYVDKANEYIRQVLAGELVACKWLKLACQRQVDDLARADWEFCFDADRANDPCDFLEALTHVAGELGGQQFVLEPWECFVVTTIFGWLHKETKLRRYRKSFILCGKGNGKSFLSSGLCLYMLASDCETGSQVLTAGSTEVQARIVFDVAYQQVVSNLLLSESFGLRAFKKGIQHVPSGSVMRSVSSKGKSIAGQLPYFCSIDETWCHRDRTVVDELTRGAAKRANSLISTITHAGPDLSSIGHEQFVNACDVLTKEIVDETEFCCMWTAGNEYNWQTENAWKAANPNWGVSVYPAAIADAARLAQKIPAQQAIFRSHNCAEWVGASFSWIDPQRLVQCRTPDLKMETFRYWHMGEHEAITRPDMPRPFVIGMDLASTRDIASVIYLCAGFVDGKVHYYCWGNHYTPAYTIETSPNAKYKGWEQSGNLIVVPGYSNDFEVIQQNILDKMRRRRKTEEEEEKGYRFVACAFDDAMAIHLSQNLQKSDIEAIKFRQNAVNYTPPMDLLTTCVLESRLHMPAEDEVLFWALSNVQVHPDRHNNLFPNKPSHNDLMKIDPAVALIMAMRFALQDHGRYLMPVKRTSLIAVLDLASGVPWSEQKKAQELQRGY